jgi:hypothetical protein
VFGQLYPHREFCEWQDVPGAEGLRVYLCDGKVRMFKDSTDSWWANERPPARWRRLLRGVKADMMFGDANGVCPVLHQKTRPIPLAKITRLQRALRGLSARVGDQAIYVAIDGLIGPHTIGATTRAMNKYAPGFTHSVLTRADVLRDAPQLAAWIERAPIQADASTPPPPPPAPVSTAQPGAAMPGYYPDDPNYAYGGEPAPGYYAPSRRGPGGLPRHEASLDVKAFIPAQYDHIRVHPGGVMAVLGVGVIVYLVATRKKKES